LGISCQKLDVIGIKARKARRSIVDGKWKIESLLPRRVPHFTWEDVRRYEREGCNLKDPAPGEAPTKAELEMVSEFLNEEQMKLMMLGAEAELRLLEREGHPVLHRERPKIDVQGEKDRAKQRVIGLQLDIPLEEIESKLIEEGYPIPIARMAVMEVKKDIGEE